MVTNIDNLKDIELDKLSDKQLNELIRHYYDSLKRSNEYSTIVSIIMSEKSRRQTKKISRISLGVSIIALLFATISLIFTSFNWYGAKSWQDSQLESLNKIIIELKK